MFSFWEEEPRRKPVKTSLQKKLLLRSRGKCEVCGFDFVKNDVKPNIHHIDGNPKHNKMSNLIVVCPNCHSKMHKYKTVKEEDFFGYVTKRKLVTIKPEKLKPTKKKTTKKPRKKTATKKNTKPKRKTAKKTSRKTTKRRKRRKREESIWDLF